MPSNELQVIGQMANLPIGELFRSVALGIAEAQTKLDESSMAVAELMSGTRVGPDGNEMDSRVYFGAHFDDETQKMVADRLSMIELGFTPTFYQFVDTVIEIKVAMSVTKVERQGPSAQEQGQPASAGGGMWSNAPNRGVAITTTPVNATYSSSYNFKAEFSSVIKTKLVPIPPPALLEDRIQRMLREKRRATIPPVKKASVSPPEQESSVALQSVSRSQARAEWAPPTGPAPKVAQKLANTQVTQVEVRVGKTPRKLGLDIKSGEKSVIPRGAKVEIESVGADAQETANRLAEKLKQVMSGILTPTVRGNRVTITFLNPGEYDVIQHPKGSSVNKLLITETNKR